MQYKNHTYILTILTTLFVVATISYFFRDLSGIFGNRLELQMFLQGLGVFAPLALIFFVIVEVVFAPLPGGIAPVVAGALFGPLLGTLYSWLGNIAGATVAFFIARQFGEKIIRFFAPSFHGEHYNTEIKKHEYALWALYATPFIPVDILSFAMGVSAMPFRQFFGAIAFAFLIRVFFWSFFGNALANILFV